MKSFCTLLLLWLTALCCQAANCAYDCDADYPFIVVVADSINRDPGFTDEEFYSYSMGVTFRVNRTEIKADNPFLKQYVEDIIPMVNRNHLQLRKVYIRGAASPEGPYENNRRLAKGRSEALLKALREPLRNQYIEMETEVSNVTEDYGYLCRLMLEANDPDYAIVNGIYMECEGDELCQKRKLMAYDGGKLWRRLLKIYFPRLRSARVMLLFSYPDIEHSPNLVKEPLHADVLPPSTVVPKVYPEWPTLGRGDSIAYTRRHLLALRTNLLADGFYMPQFGWAPSLNAQLEYYPLDGHYTYNAGFTWSNHRHWEDREFFQIRDAQLEVRRYFKGGGKFTGTYLGLYAQGSVYGIGLSETKGWEGEGGGAGLSLGYVLPISRKGAWRLEFMIAAGLYVSRHDPFVYGNPITGTIDGDYYYNYFGSASSFKKRNHRFTWMGPTQFGIQLTRDILYRRKKAVTIKR